jgi:hypothetical protein
MITNPHTTLRFDIGVSRMFPGEKLLAGDPRWGQQTYSFVRETHNIESLARATRVRREFESQNNTAAVLAHRDGEASANSPATRFYTNAVTFYRKQA